MGTKYWSPVRKGYSTKCYQILKICHGLPDLSRNVGEKKKPSYLAPSLVASSGAVPNKIRSPGRKGIISSCCKLLHFHNQATLKYDNQRVVNTQNVLDKLYKWNSWGGAETLSFVGVLTSIIFHHDFAQSFPFFWPKKSNKKFLQRDEWKHMVSIWQYQAYRETFQNNGCF